MAKEIPSPHLAHSHLPCCILVWKLSHKADANFACFDVHWDYVCSCVRLFVDHSLVFDGFLQISFVLWWFFPSMQDGLIQKRECYLSVSACRLCLCLKLLSDVWCQHFCSHRSWRMQLRKVYTEDRRTSAQALFIEIGSTSDRTKRKNTLNTLCKATCISTFVAVSLCFLFTFLLILNLCISVRLCPVFFSWI